MSIIPGSFPQNDVPEPPGVITESASKVMEQEELQVFSFRQLGNAKSRHQVHIIKQMEALVYILVGFQFIKYCHSACIIPIILHVSAQLVLSCGSVTMSRSRADQTWITTIIRTLNQADEFLQEEKERRQDIIFRRVCFFLYAKTFVAWIYHCLVIIWLIPITNDDDLSMIEHGTWWFVSFIGESTPSIPARAPWFKKIVPLGLPQLLLSDILIMIVQLILFQCIFRQSTVTYLGQRRSNDELTIIRTTATDPSGPIQIIKDAPVVLKVKLYETISKEAIIGE